MTNSADPQMTAAKYVVSLGSLCLTGKLLQRMGVKTASYPFDWIFSNPKMVAHCIGDDFRTFLDRSLYRSNSFGGGRHCYHMFYGPDLNRNAIFNHRDPTIDEDYDYLVRCVSRFRLALASDGPSRPLFVLITGDDVPGDTSNFDLVSGAFAHAASSVSLLYLSFKTSPVRAFKAIKQVGDSCLVQLNTTSALHNGTRFREAADDDLACSIIRKHAQISQLHSNIN